MPQAVQVRLVFRPLPGLGVVAALPLGVAVTSAQVSQWQVEPNSRAKRVRIGSGAAVMILDARAAKARVGCSTRVL